MAQLAELISRTVDGVLEGNDASIRRSLASNVRAIRKLNEILNSNAGVTEEAILELIGEFPMTDIARAGRLLVVGNLDLTETRERTVTATGGASLGPVNLQASYKTGSTEAARTGVSVELELVFENKSRLREVVETLVGSLLQPI